MPQQYLCNFAIPAGSTATGGKLTGGFDNNRAPVLQNGDSIAITVSYLAASGSPLVLIGTTVFSESQLALTNQDTATPFVRGAANGNFICLASQEATGDVLEVTPRCMPSRPCCTAEGWRVATS